MSKQKRKRKRKRRTRPRPEAEQNPVLRLWNEFKADDALFEDRREYGVEDFMKAYNLTMVAAERLHYMFRQHERDELEEPDDGYTSLGEEQAMRQFGVQ